jgi:hypothetical protein
LLKIIWKLPENLEINSSYVILQQVAAENHLFIYLFGEGFAIVKSALCCLSHTASPFCSVIFWRFSLKLFA